MAQFYSYLWLRDDGTPYYAGKGKDRRAFQTQHRTVHPPRDKTRIVILSRSSEAEAFSTEEELIANWGRKDLGTGCLRNMTEGGEGRAGAIVSEETRQKQSAAKKGKPSSWKGKKASAETREKQSISAKKRGCRLAGWNKGKLATEAHRKKQSVGLKKFWADHARPPVSAETRKKQSLAKKGKPWTEAQRKAHEKQNG